MYKKEVTKCDSQVSVMVAGRSGVRERCVESDISNEMKLG